MVVWYVPRVRRTSTAVLGVTFAVLGAHCAARAPSGERDPDVVAEHCRALAARTVRGDIGTARTTHVELRNELSSAFDVDVVCVAVDDEAAVELPATAIDALRAHRPVALEVRTTAPARRMEIYVELRDHKTREYTWAMPGHHELAYPGESPTRIAICETERTRWYERPTLLWDTDTKARDAGTD